MRVARKNYEEEKTAKTEPEGCCGCAVDRKRAEVIVGVAVGRLYAPLSSQGRRPRPIIAYIVAPVDDTAISNRPFMGKATVAYYFSSLEFHHAIDDVAREGATPTCLISNADSGAYPPCPRQSRWMKLRGPWSIAGTLIRFHRSRAVCPADKIIATTPPMKRSAQSPTIFMFSLMERRLY